MRVLLADDRSQVRWALHAVIREEPGWAVVGEVSEAENLLSKALALEPDLIVMEWELAGQAVDQLLPVLHTLNARPWVIVLSRWPEARKAALAAGADDFISKADPPDKLLTALHNIVRKERPGTPSTYPMDQTDTYPLG
jgi:DNA-binding NarL/FixJ family response regulator